MTDCRECLKRHTALRKPGPCRCSCDFVRFYAMGKIVRDHGTTYPLSPRIDLPRAEVTQEALMLIALRWRRRLGGAPCGTVRGARKGVRPGDGHGDRGNEGVPLGRLHAPPIHGRHGFGVWEIVGTRPEGVGSLPGASPGDTLPAVYPPPRSIGRSPPWETLE